MVSRRRPRLPPGWERAKSSSPIARFQKRNRERIAKRERGRSAGRRCESEWAGFLGDIGVEMTSASMASDERELPVMQSAWRPGA